MFKLCRITECWRLLLNNSKIHRKTDIIHIIQHWAVNWRTTANTWIGNARVSYSTEMGIITFNRKFPFTTKPTLCIPPNEYKCVKPREITF